MSNVYSCTTCRSRTKKKIESPKEVAKFDPIKEPKQVCLVDMFFLSTKFGFPLFIFIISQSQKKESSTSNTIPKKKDKKDMPKEVDPSNDSFDGVMFPHLAPTKPQEALA